MEKAEQNGNYAVAVLGAVVGGIIGTLPWVLCYVYADMMYSILSVLIPICAFKGFQICKGKVDRKLLIILGLISFAMITLATLVVIPHLLLIQQYGKTSVEMFNALYGMSQFKEAIVHDYIFSLLFTILGAGSIIANMKKSMDNGDEKITWTNSVNAPHEDEINEVKSVFKSKQAMSKEHTISKAELMSELKDRDDVLKFLMARGIVVRKKDQYYYREEVEANPGKRMLKIFAITFGITILVVALIVILIAALV